MPARIWVAEPHGVTRFWTLLRKASIGSYRDGCFGIAKGAAYSSLLAFFPVLTTIATILFQANAGAITRTVVRLLYDVIPPGTEDLVQALFNIKGQRPTSLLVVAVVLATWAGSGVMMSLMEGFRSIYKIRNGRPFLEERGIAMLLVFVAAIPALGASSLIVFGNRARRDFIFWLGLGGGSDLRGWVQLAGQLLTFGIAFTAVVLIMTLVYYIGPNRKQSLHQLLPGAIVATILWMLSTLAFGWYVRHISNYNVLYGSVGAGIALLVWSYVLAVVALFGCEFNAARERLATER